MGTSKKAVCPHPGCANYGSGEQVIKAGKDKRRRQRFVCNGCHRYFSPTKGTLCYRLRKSKKDFLEALAMLAERNSLAAVARIKEVKEETVARWVEKAGRHAQEVEEYLIRDFHLSQVQLDELWTYVKNKGQKGGTPRVRKAGSAGRR
jgi:transposase-like protein